jgi:hypothetical protein
MKRNGIFIGKIAIQANVKPFLAPDNTGDVRALY